MERDEAAISKARAAWREQDEETFGSLDPAAVKKRASALLDLLMAHVPLTGEED